MEFEAHKDFIVEPLHVHTIIYKGIPTIVSMGEADAHTYQALKNALGYAVACRTTELILDIRGMDYMDSSGFRAIVWGRHELEKVGGTLVVVDLTAPIERAIKLLALDALVTIVHTLGEAVEHVKRYPLQPPKAA